MNSYKKVIKDVETRRKLLDALAFVPDKQMIRLQYLIKTGRLPNLKSPKRYTEKIQWYKLNYRNPQVTQCSDKYAVRFYVEEKGLGHLLNELYAVYDAPEDIDFESLPTSFALKLNNGSGTNIFVEDKEKLDSGEAIGKLRGWMNRLKKSNPGRE